MSRPPRIEGFAYVGIQRYFLTICTRDRIARFTSVEVIGPVVDQFLQTAADCGMAIIAYCVMPDHAHFLVDGVREDADLQWFVKVAKQKTGYWFKREHHGALWQEGFYDRVLRGEETTESVVYYMVANPVRKGLAIDVNDYPFWGSGRYSREELLASLDLESRT